MSQRYVALLRGINVGGCNKVAMADLRACFVALGHQDVETYIQSGNVLFSSAAEREDISRGVEAALRERLGLAIVTVVRTVKDISAVIEANPFRGCEAHLHVAFISSGGGEASTKVDERYAPERFAGGPGVIYLHCPNGMGRSKLTSTFLDRLAGAPVTVRNWKTVTRLGS